MADTSLKQHIVIIGGGIIGCTTAYYLTHHKAYSPETTAVTILEASSVAGGASGKAGGLIAKWAYPRELVDITFKEHERLAQAHDGANRWGWRYTNVGQWEGKGEAIDSSEMPSAISLNKKDGMFAGGTDPRRRGKSLLPDDLDWVKETLTHNYEPMAGERETAQVHPYQFTTSMCALAQENGARVILGKATSIAYVDFASKGKQTRAVASVTYTDASSGESHTIPASHVVVSAGPWTQTILPQAPISGTRAHSITIRPTRPVSAYALFTEIAMPEPYPNASPEIYARPNNEVYACSPGDGLPLPASTAEAQVDHKVCDALFEQVSAISPELRGGEVTARQACYLPNVNSGPRGCPIVGEDEKVKGLIIAAGHTCWGICNAPGTGKAISELILDGKIVCGNLAKLAPRMFF
ncbi:hypothetical protein M0805_004938 [Coniferiporia weirii]|nr:hypothetical protein M0805_004938 [Coniferiporia weirii]